MTHRILVEPGSNLLADIGDIFVLQVGEDVPLPISFVLGDVVIASVLGTIVPTQFVVGDIITNAYSVSGTMVTTVNVLGNVE